MGSIKRPISLEIEPKLPDDRVVLDREETNPPDQELDLEDSIDALLEEVDSACASVENPGSEQSDAKGIDKASPPTADAAGGENTEAADEHEASAPDVQDDTLEALERVEEKTQELLEDTIDQLLEDAPESQAATVAPEDESDEASIESDAVESVIDEAAIDEQLDALDESGVADTSSETESPESEADQATASGTPEEVENSSSPSESVVPDELLDQIADDLTGAAPQVDAADPEPTDDAAAEPASPEESKTETVEAAAETSDAVSEADANGEDPLDDAIDDLLSGEPSEAADTSEAPTDASQEEDILSTLADLDATLADAGTELMGDFETPEGDVISADLLDDSNDASALLEQLGLDEIEFKSPADEAAGEQATFDAAAAIADDSSAELGHAPTASQASPTPGTKSGSSVADGTNRIRPKSLEPMPLIPEPEGEVESIWQSARRTIVRQSQHALVMARTHAAPIGARMVIAINKPVKQRPAQLRDSIGYLALWTLLMAMILWVYLVFIRTTPTPTPTQAPSRMLEPGEVVDPLRAHNPTP